MKKIIIVGFMVLGSVSAFASSVKVICEKVESKAESYKVNTVSAQSVENKINPAINKALEDGYNKVSAPSVAATSTKHSDHSREAVTICVTVQK